MRNMRDWCTVFCNCLLLCGSGVLVNPNTSVENKTLFSDGRKSFEKKRKAKNYFLSSLEPSKSERISVSSMKENKALLSISQIRPHLFLAGYGCITSSMLKQFGITHAVDATNLKTKPIPGLAEVMEVPIDDSLLSKVSDYFEPVTQFIDKVKNENGKVVIYCAAGVSRSATLAIMYLVISENMPLDQAYYAVNQVRPIISPNIGFWRQMIDYESAKNSEGKSSVELIRGRMARPIPSVYLHRSLVNSPI